MKRNESGQIFPLVGLVIIGVFAIALLLAYVTAELLHASQAQTAADAAALAGAAKGREAAVQVAHANHADLVSFTVLGEETQVEAKVGSQIKMATARRF